MSRSRLFQVIGPKYLHRSIRRLRRKAPENKQTMKEEEVNEQPLDQNEAQDEPAAAAADDDDGSQEGEEDSDHSENEGKEGDAENAENVESQKKKTKKKKKRKSRDYENNEDPIMFEPIQKKQAVVLSRPNGSKVAFNVNSLVSYIYSTCDFLDPITRVPFTEEQIEAIDSRAKMNGIESNLIDLRSDKKKKEDKKIHLDGIVGLERIAGDIIHNILTIAENTESEYEADYLIMNREIPEFIDYYNQLKTLDRAYSLQAMKHWRAYLRGPPNCPNDVKNNHALRNALAVIESL